MANTWKLAVFSAAAAATVAFAPAAQAAVSINYGAGIDRNNVTTGFEASFMGNNTDDPFTNTFDSFTLNTSGSLSAVLSTTTAGLSFSLIQVGPGPVLNVPLTLIPVGGSTNGTGAGPVSVGPGTYQLQVNGGGVSPSSFGGTLSFAAVPEPATWAMMLMGFGAIGFGMRRRKAVSAQPRMRVQYA